MNDLIDVLEALAILVDDRYLKLAKTMKCNCKNYNNDFLGSKKMMPIHLKIDDKITPDNNEIYPLVKRIEAIGLIVGVSIEYVENTK